MTMQVTVVDYGMGNLYSVQRALESVGAEVTVSGDAAVVAGASRLILPGVGAFADGMAGLRERGLVEPIRRHAQSGRPLMGICLGMQMLAGVSEEFGEHAGLDLIAGRVVAVPAVTTEGSAQKIPNIGWRNLAPAENADWSRTALATTRAGESVYLVHSFHFVPTDARHVLAHCEYGGHRVTAAVGGGRMIGCQFHPEKSGAVGLQILSRFVQD
ncbi:imidazole glycerol phosphate synthase subunit HisH [Steroidobacter agaridevorans]|uniref:imidazole glycerol phosphate synthase subunit HisH n=1 Tax=Steroidobacter agaridevorans TaxID=2695856 RepID=UPI001322278A|nr:imidazole glycerol phosphate synthase subunit HisH [Steroidobacter agaridevorans]GFE85593.1 imidazole glycerol phosphate synthase subunit HisH 1 [Steroidobacter agaridevorans]